MAFGEGAFFPVLHKNTTKSICTHADDVINNINNDGVSKFEMGNFNLACELSEDESEAETSADLFL